MENSDVMSKEFAGDSLNDALVGITNVRMNNMVRGCECAPKYEVAQRWKDGRIRLSEGCGIHPNIMLDPNGTYRLQVNEDMSDWPEDIREDRKRNIKDIKEKSERAGCELLLDGKTYTFKGYY